MDAPTKAMMVAWLRQQLATVPDVKAVRTDPDPTMVFQPTSADMVVRTWMGARIDIYLLDAVPRSRDIRSLLKENTRNGIGSLFIVVGALLPDDDTVTRHVDAWQEALYTLNGDWIYGLYATDDGYHLVQVHYDYASTAKQYTIWHMGDFSIENVAVRRRDVQDGLRGTWAVADIASPAFKRRVHQVRREHRYHYQTRYTRQQTRHTRPAVDQGQLAECCALLNVSPDADEATVKAAYRRQAMMLHPDVSALPPQESDRRFKALNRAYETIKQHQGWR